MLNIGFVLQKKAAATLPVIEEQSIWRNLRNFFTNITWLLGFLLININFFIFLFAVEFGSLSLVTPIAGVGLVVLVIFSFFYLKEPITKSEIIGIITIISGVIILGVTNPASESTYTLNEMNGFFKEYRAIIYIIIFTSLMIGMVTFSLIKKIPIAGALLGMSSGFASGLGVIFTKAVTGGFETSNFWATFVNAMKQWEWWIYFLLLLGFNIASTIFLQLGYQKSKAVIVSPLFSIASLVIPVLGGLIIFLEWSTYSIGIIAGKSIALVLVAIGIVLLSIASTKEPVEKDEKNNNNDTTSN
jgi:drug/metabolite transporter (DMT)-like permease